MDEPLTLEAYLCQSRNDHFRAITGIEAGRLVLALKCETRPDEPAVAFYVEGNVVARKPAQA